MTITLIIIAVLLFLIYKAIQGNSYRNHTEPRFPQNHSYTNPRRVENHITEEQKFLRDVFTKSQGHLLVAMLFMVKKGCENSSYLDTKTKKIDTIKHNLGVTNTSFINFMNGLDMDTIPAHFSKFTAMQLELSILYIHEVLTCGGQPSEREYHVTLNVLRNIMNVSESEYLKCLSKFDALNRGFYYNYY